MFIAKYIQKYRCFVAESTDHLFQLKAFHLISLVKKQLINLIDWRKQLLMGREYSNPLLEST